MSSSFDRLRSVVLADVAVRRAQAQSKDPTRYSQLVGTFLQESLKRQGMSLKDFAQALRLKPDIAQLILNGDLPPNMLSEEFMGRVARAVGYEPDMLRIMWGLDVKPRKTSKNSKIKSNEGSGAD